MFDLMDLQIDFTGADYLTDNDDISVIFFGSITSPKVTMYYNILYLRMRLFFLHSIYTWKQINANPVIRVYRYWD